MDYEQYITHMARRYCETHHAWLFELLFGSAEDGTERYELMAPLVKITFGLENGDRDRDGDGDGDGDSGHDSSASSARRKETKKSNNKSNNNKDNRPDSEAAARHWDYRLLRQIKKCLKTVAFHPPYDAADKLHEKVLLDVFGALGLLWLWRAVFSCACVLA